MVELLIFTLIFVIGVGAGVGSAIFAHIAQTTTEAERAPAISILMASRQIGLLFGPGLNVALQKCDFYIGKYHVDKYTSPGVSKRLKERRIQP